MADPGTNRTVRTTGRAPTSDRAPVRGGRKVGRKPAFDTADAVAAAFAEGIDRFTMSSVAARLGVVPAALYRLFPSRDDLVIACLDTAGATIARPEPGMTWRAALRAWADECWRLCEDHPGLESVLYSFPAAPTRIDEVFRAYADHLAQLGKTLPQVMFALDFIGDTVLASHLGVSSMRAVQDDGRTGLETVRDAVGDTEATLQPKEWWTGRRAMDTKVEFILTGLERDWPET
jgi:AcrR family transcriptional regulator